MSQIENPSFLKKNKRLIVLTGLLFFLINTIMYAYYYNGKLIAWSIIWKLEAGAIIIILSTYITHTLIAKTQDRHKITPQKRILSQEEAEQALISRIRHRGFEVEKNNITQSIFLRTIKVGDAPNQSNVTVGLYKDIYSREEGEGEILAAVGWSDKGTVDFETDPIKIQEIKDMTLPDRIRFLEESFSDLAQEKRRKKEIIYLTQEGKKIDLADKNNDAPGGIGVGNE